MRSQRIERALEALKELGGDATIQEGGGKLTIYGNGCPLLDLDM
jgi:hypothetical protein